MRLRFVPKKDAMPKWPGRGAGDYPYVGRKFDPSTRNNKPTENPAEVVADSRDGRRLIELCRRDGDLLPYDLETAKHCGVKFVALTRDSAGEWVPEPPKKIRKADD